MEEESNDVCKNCDIAKYSNNNNSTNLISEEHMPERAD